MLDYSKFPSEHMIGGLQRYFEHGIEPGSFMESVLCNDLRGACLRADDVNLRNLVGIVGWLYNEAPLGSWGSPEAYANTIQHGGYAGAMAAGSDQQ
jgi:hypothetical protein